MSDKAYLLCLRTVDTYYSMIVPGSTKSNCSACGNSVYISPESLKVKEDRGALVLCMQCSVEYIRTARDEDPLEAFVFTQGQVEEAKKMQETKHENIQRN